MANFLQDSFKILAAIAVIIVTFSIVYSLLSFLVRLKHKDRTRKKQLTIRKYATKLGRLLRIRYGVQESYTPAQVKQMMQKWGYNTSDYCYGLAMYCNYYDFTNYHNSIGESCDYDAMRDEISRCLFGSHTEFDISALIEVDNQSHSHSHSYSGDSDYDSSNDSSDGHSHSWESSGYDSSDISSGSDYSSTDSYSGYN